MKKNLHQAFINWFTFKNFVILLSISIVSLLVRLLFLSFEVKFGLLNSDFLFFISTFTGVSLGSFIRKFLELFDFPQIKWNLILNFFKSPLSNKLQLIKDFLSIFKSPKDKMTLGGSDFNLDNKQINDVNKTNVMLMENAGSGSGSASGSASGAPQIPPFPFQNLQVERPIDEPKQLKLTICRDSSANLDILRECRSIYQSVHVSVDTLIEIEAKSNSWELTIEFGNRVLRHLDQETTLMDQSSSVNFNNQRINYYASQFDRAYNNNRQVRIYDQIHTLQEINRNNLTMKEYSDLIKTRIYGLQKKIERHADRKNEILKKLENIDNWKDLYNKRRSDLITQALAKTNQSNSQ